jgi:hypothetical protein
MATSEHSFKVGLLLFSAFYLFGLSKGQQIRYGYGSMLLVGTFTLCSLVGPAMIAKVAAACACYHAILRSLVAFRVCIMGITTSIELFIFRSILNVTVKTGLLIYRMSPSLKNYYEIVVTVKERKAVQLNAPLVPNPPAVNRDVPAEAAN